MGILTDRVNQIFDELRQNNDFDAFCVELCRIMTGASWNRHNQNLVMDAVSSQIDEKLDGVKFFWKP